jgi:D-alanine-D-alanine ligase
VKIVVLMGGTSPERDVSLASGREIARALGAGGHQVVCVDAAGGRLIQEPDSVGSGASGIGREPPRLGQLEGLGDGGFARTLEEAPEAQGSQAVFVALHGGAGEDGRVQAVLDLTRIPYTGSGPLGSALAMDKLVTKELFLSGGVPTPPWLVGQVEPSAVEDGLGGFPVVVKTSREGSTVGVSVIKSADRLEEALAQTAGFSGPPIVEKFIPGRELAVGVLGDGALPIVEIRPTHEIYDYECKYTKGMSEYEVPAPLSAEVTAEVQELAVRAHRILRLSAYSRVDFRLDEDERPWCLEANSLPGMTATSLLPKAAREAGITFEELCERIVQLAIEAKR